ncbi:uncharacterized protein TrAtP1_011990 [Trichoderma atroviride]|uniref:uncharacterized protein n=1 Tax=Hypocrea atroviridis TaxID=63577 RepID=UPI003322FF03|nr:hypothetical protein TrAtP1_011990 [Trichoderma atroviride]
MSNFAKIGDIHAKAEVDDEEMNNLKGFHLSTSFEADYVDPNPHPEDEVIPTEPNPDAPPATPNDRSREPTLLMNKIKRGFPNFTSDPVPPPDKTHGVPVELTLTPVSYFDAISVEIIFRELNEADMVALRALYDKLTSLAQSRMSLYLEIMKPPLEHSSQEAATSTTTSPKYSNLFPTFSKTCQDRQRKVESLQLEASSGLGQFLQDYRIKKADSKHISDFLVKYQTLHDSARGLYEQDTLQWRALRRLKETADAYQYPLNTVEDMIAARPVNGTLVMEIVPENVQMSSLLNIYRHLGKDIRDWRTQEDSDLTISKFGVSRDASIPAFTTTYVSFYADPAKDKALVSIDNDQGSVLSAVAAARKEASPKTIQYGLRESTNQLEWLVLGDGNVWGMLEYDNVDGSDADADKKLPRTQYLGYLKDKNPYGYGVMKYAGGLDVQG